MIIKIIEFEIIFLLPYLSFKIPPKNAPRPAIKFPSNDKIINYGFSIRHDLNRATQKLSGFESI